MNTEKFTGKAQVYAQFRPSYPNSLIEYLFNELKFTKNSIVADIGAGTGKLSKLLLNAGLNVTCVEPNENMRQISIELLSSFENFVSVKAPAENTTLKSQSIDFITVAQAFHWFDQVEFKKECQRILKPSGKVVLIWNSRIPDCPISSEIYQIRQNLSDEFKGFSGGMVVENKTFKSFFKNEKLNYAEFENSQTFDKEGFVGFNLSSSHAPKVESPFYQQFVNEISNLFDKRSTNGTITYPQLTKIYCGEV